VSSLGLGLGHVYQGWNSVVRTGVLALVFGAAVAWSHTLLPMMLLHTVIDTVNGSLASSALALTLEDEVESTTPNLMSSADGPHAM